MILARISLVYAPSALLITSYYLTKLVRHPVLAISIEIQTKHVLIVQQTVTRAIKMVAHNVQLITSFLRTNPALQPALVPSIVIQTMFVKRKTAKLLTLQQVIALNARTTDTHIGYLMACATNSRTAQTPNNEFSTSVPICLQIALE